MTDHLKMLEKAAEKLESAHMARDQAIIDAHNAGTNMTAIANSVRLSRMQVHRIIKAHNAENAPSPLLKE